MAISTDKILKKMMEELQQAQANQQNESRLQGHIEKVHLLCELLLDEDDQGRRENTPTQNQLQISASEMKAMLGESGTIKANQRKQKLLDEEDGNGTSIFDF